MMITIVSNFLNHHQLLLCNAIRKHCDEFYFIATKHIPEDRLTMGYTDMDLEYDFVLRLYDGTVKKSKVDDVLSRSDAVIFGDNPDEFIEYRMNQGKLSFLSSERFFKKGAWRRFYPPVYKKVKNRSSRYADKDYYVLCNSAFLPRDLSLMGFPEEKCFKWGYFPEVEHLSEYPERNNKKLRILWVGRLLELKRGDTAIRACANLKKQGIDFSLDFIGEGDCLNSLKSLSEKLGISDNVNFHGFMSPEDVRRNMLSADVFLFTSNYREGWGAVVNEAMSCGCAVLASSAVGSVPYLIEDGKNGIVYRFGSQKDMDAKLLSLATDVEKRKMLGKNAMHTINNVYSPEVAGERLVQFVKSENRNELKFESGPMSRAEIIKNKWYK